MSTASVLNPTFSAYPRIVELTIQALEVARYSASAVAAGISESSVETIERVRKYEEDLDTLDRQINEAVGAAITRVNEKEARELLTCLKFVIELERIGDLLLNFVNRCATVTRRISPQDAKDLTTMAVLLEKMLGDVEHAFTNRDLQRTLLVLRADSEMDRLRNLMFVRHIENPDNEPRQESFHLVFMTQMLERAGDAAKNLAEEVCHLLSGRSIRHLLRATDKPYEEMFLDWLRRQDGQRV